MTDDVPRPSALGRTAMPESSSPLLQRPLPSLSAWVAHFREAEIPVLAYTAQRMGQMAAHEDSVDMARLDQTIGADPLMTLRVLRHMGMQLRGSRRDTPETVMGALVLMGLSPFFHHFAALPTAQDWLADVPEALTGLSNVVVRSHRAAQFAQGFAAHRGDPDAAVLHEVALLHDFADMLLWLHAPELALEIQRRKAARPGLRSREAQLEVLGLDLAALQQALMRAWNLPEHLVHLADDQHAHSPQVRNVLLAVRLARHSAAGWQHPGLGDDVAAVADLLQLDQDATRRLLPQLA
jgi:HD-like signal output (HDOD) protein